MENRNNRLDLGRLKFPSLLHPQGSSCHFLRLGDAGQRGRGSAESQSFHIVIWLKASNQALQYKWAKKGGENGHQILQSPPLRRARLLWLLPRSEINLRGHAQSCKNMAMVFPQYRIPVSRLNEEWAFLLRMERLRRGRQEKPHCRITDNSEPWIRNPASVAEFVEIAQRVNQTVETWSPQRENS